MPSPARTAAIPRIARPFDATKLYALNLNAGFFQTQAVGGEAGVGSGFGAMYLFVPRTLTASFRRFGGKLGASDGWTALIANTSQPQAQARNDVQTQVTPSLGALLGSDLGRVHALILYHTGTALQVYLDSAGRVASLAISGFTPSAAAEQLGLAASGFTATDIHILGRLTFRGTPSAANLQTLLDDARMLGDLPVAVPGAVITHRASLRDTLQARKRAPYDSEIAPSLPDTVTTADVDAMARAGAPTIKMIDPSVDGRVTYGALGSSATSYLLGPVGGGFRGNLTGFTVRVPVTFWSLSGNEYFASCAPTSGYRGWMFSRNATALSISVGTGSAAPSSTKTLTAADLGFPRLLHLVYDGTAVEGFLDGVSTGKATAAIALATERMSIGGLGGLLPAAGESIFGLAGANHIATPAEVSADFATWQRTARLANIIPAKPDANRYEISLDVVANGGPQNGIPAQVLDRVGTDHLTRVGTGLQVAQRVERVWSYETTPILQGAGPTYSAPDYFSGASNALPGDAAGFVIWVLCTVTSQAVASGSRRLFTQRGTANPGWGLLTTTTNGAFTFGCGGAGGAANSPSGTIAATDLGKLLLVHGVWDGTANMARLYNKRLQVGTGSAVAGGFAPDPVVPMIGRYAGATTNFAEGVVVHGVGYAVGLPSLAQIQAHSDDVQASERNRPMPGLASVWLDFTQDIADNGGVMPATMLDRGAGGVHFTRQGTLAIGAQMARAFGW